MSAVVSAAVPLAGVGISVWLASFILEAIRPAPFLSLLRRAESWQKATNNYGRIECPAMLIWGDRDWALPSEREYDAAHTPAAEVVTVGRGGHFLPLDRPRELTQAILRFATSQGAMA